MEIVRENDYLEVIADEKTTNNDKDIIFDLYQPLIGFKAASVYFSLLTLVNESHELLSHNYIFSKMQIAPGDFLQSRRCLEAVGLLNTYLKKESKTKTYLYKVNKPLSANEFFNDILFKGLLIKYLGEKKVNELVFKYLNAPIDKEEYSDISASFTEVFNINLNDNVFLKDLGINQIDENNIVIEFDVDALNKVLLNDYHVTKDNLPNKKDIEQIKKVSALYHLSESAMADLLMSAYVPNSRNKYDFKKVLKDAKEVSRYNIGGKTYSATSAVFGDTNLAKKVQMFNEMAPYEFLRIRQNNTPPSPSDLKIIDDLSHSYGLTNGVINVLIDYVLEKTDGEFPSAYIKKIAASFVRKNITTAIDAMNEVNSSNKAKPSKPTTEKVVVKEEPKKEDEESFEDILKELDEM